MASTTVLGVLGKDEEELGFLCRQMNITVVRVGDGLEVVVLVVPPVISVVPKAAFEILPVPLCLDVILGLVRCDGDATCADYCIDGLEELCRELGPLSVRINCGMP